VYVAVECEGERIPLDASHGPHAGWEVANQYGKRREWALNGAPGFMYFAAIAAGLLLTLVRR
jgi:hypothetical protein